MKKKSDILMIILILIFSCIIFGFFYKSITKKNTSSIKNNPLIDSINFFNFQKAYLAELINIGYWENSRSHNFNTIRFYELNDLKKKSPKLLTNLFRKKKQNIVIRYTEIGCNSCADSTFKYIKTYKKLDSLYNIFVFVDFNNYDAYLKWRKVSEIKYPVYWVKKGVLPFKIESENSSYIFTINSFLEVNNFFIPNSRFIEYIDYYFYSLESK